MNFLKSVGSMVIIRKEVRFLLLINFQVVLSKPQISGILREINNWNSLILERGRKPHHATVLNLLRVGK